MKKFLIILFFLVFSNAIALANHPVQNEDFEEIYNSLEVPNFEYIFSLDPYQAEEYQKYYASPYPLLRSGVNFTFKNITIPAGYYLLTPRKKDGVQYILFKQEGKVKYIIPTYKQELVEPAFYKQHVPTPEKTKWQKMCDWGNKMVGKVSKNSKKTAPPKVYIDVNEIGEEFWQVIVYYDSQKYYLIFKQ